MKSLFLILLLLSIFTLNTVNGDRSKTIFLQPDERYDLQLDQFYDFAAFSFSYPPNFPQDSIRKPYQQFDQYQNVGNYIQTLSSIQDGDKAKFFIGTINSYDSAKQLYGQELVYYRTYIDPQTGILQRQQLGKTTLLANLCVKQVQNKIIYGSFYSTTSGFVTVNVQDYQLLVRFDYSSQGLFLTTVNNLFLDTHTAIQDQGSAKIYIVYSTPNGFSTNASLSLYDPSNNSFVVVDTQSIQFSRIITGIIFDTSFSLLFFDNLQSFINVSPDFATNKLLVQTTPLNVELTLRQITYSSIQQFGENLIATFAYNTNDTEVYTLKRSQFVMNNAFQLVNINKFQIQISKDSALKSFLIDENHMVYQQDYYFLIMNLATQENIFASSINNQSNYLLRSLEFVGNQIFVQLRQNQDGSCNFIPVQFQVPSVILSGQNQVYEFGAFSQGSQYVSNIQVTISTTQSMVTSMSTNSVLISNLLTNITDSVYSIPLEAYITGSNLNPLIDSTKATNLKNISFNKLVNLQTQQPYTNDYLYKIYPTDGFLSTIIVSILNNQYYFSAGTPNVPQKIVSSFYQQQPTDMIIGAIDNYGTFIPESLMKSNPKSIFVPFTNNDQLIYNQIPNLSCNNAVFNFASDPSQNILFVLCGSQITQYEYSFVSGGDKFTTNAKILSQTTLTEDFSSYNKLICINGNLFIYSDTQITCYNYILKLLYPNVVQVPKLSANQELILFKDTFIIIIIADPIQTITQYSYGDFQNTQFQKLRNLFIDSNHPINPTLNFIPKRNFIEYLFLGTTNAGEYVIYRVNAPSSQNQLYGITNIQSDAQHIPIISSDAICILSKSVSCWQILQEVSISFSQDVSLQLFNSVLQISNQVSLSFGDQQLVMNVEIMRNANTQYGIINQQNQQLQNARTQLQDTITGVVTSFQLNDHELYNACLLGWDSYYNNHGMYITNRMLMLEQFTENIRVSYILGNLKVQTITENMKIGMLGAFTDNGISNNCNPVEDQTSILKINDSSFSMNIYLLCPTYYYTLNTTFAQNANGDLTSVTWSPTTPINYVNKYNLTTIQQAVKIQSQIILLDLTNSQQYIIDQNQAPLSVLKKVTSQYDPIAYYAVRSLQVQLIFFSNGQMSAKNIASGVSYSASSIQELLIPFLFSVDGNDQIKTIIQLADNLYMIQFANSFMYEITFSLNNKGELIINTAKLFYYSDGINSLTYALKGNQYTLILGLSRDNSYPMVLLYTNSHEQNNQLLIESSFVLNGNQKVFTFAEFIQDNQVKLYTSDYQYEIVKISDFIQITIAGSSSAGSRQLPIYPISLSYSDKQYITFVVNSYDQPAIKTYSVKKIFFLNMMLILTLIIF